MARSTTSRSAKRAARVSSVVADGKRRHAATKKRARESSSSATFTWRHLTLRVTHTPNYLHQGWSHLELRVLTPVNAPCPVTATGYLSHFIDADALQVAGGMVAFFTAWLEREAATKAWRVAEAKWRQLELL